MVYQVLTKVKNDPNNDWEIVKGSVASDMDRTLVKLQYYRKNWGQFRQYRLQRIG